MRAAVFFLLLVLLAGGCGTVREFIDRHIIEGQAGPARVAAEGPP